MKKSGCRYRITVVGLISTLFVALSADTALAASGPVPYFYITWTAEATGSSDTTDPVTGTRTVVRHRIVMVGSTVERKYDDGHLDDFPYDLTVTQDYDRVETTPCQGGGVDRNHTSISIRDPNRYQFGPDHTPQVVEPFQRPDGTWYIDDPFVGFFINRFFRYQFHGDFVRCNGESGSDDTFGDSEFYVLPLDDPAHPPPAAINGDPHGNVFTSSRQYTSNSLILGDGDPPLRVNWTVTARRLIGRDLTVDRLEVTQGLQDRANLIPLVQERRTVVRAYLGVGKDHVPISGVTGKLTGYRGNTVLGSVRPFNPGSRITAPAFPDWHQIDHTLNFELPLAWTKQPLLRLEVEVNDDRSVTEINYSNNKLSELVSTIPCARLKIAYVPVRYTPPGGYTPADPSANIAVGQEFMRKIYPVPDKKLEYFPWPGLTWTTSISTDAGAAALLSELKRRLLNSSAPAYMIYGWTPSLAYPSNGLGETPGLAGFGNDTEAPNRWRRTLAHEIGHTFGLDHNTETTNGHHWFDVYDRVIKPPNEGGELLDVMVPAKTEPEAWISLGSYLQLFEKLGLGAAQESMLGQAAATTDNLVVSGLITNGAAPTGSIDPLYRTSTAPQSIPPPPKAGPGYCINLKNNTTLLSQTCFDVGFDGDGQQPVTVMPYGMVVPYPSGLNRIELTRGTTTLISSRVASPSAPSVTVTFPNAPGLTLSGNQMITWTGSDPDGDPLAYNILYSRDNGVTWIGVASGITTTSYVLDFAGMPGSSSARIKVQVSDGFNSAEDISDNLFRVANKPPTAVIVSPPSGASFPANTKVTLEGTGADLQDGSLGDAALRWSSDKDGLLGSGRVLQVNLSPGAHRITLTGRDSSGLTSTATITSTAVPPPPSVLSNISTRAFVQTGDNVMIGGLIVTGSGPKKLILRAIGPSLAQYGITDPLLNPTLELHDHTGARIAFNDNWMDARNKQAIIDSGFAPNNNLESAILATLDPGNYTAIVRGVNNGTGIALVEGYDLDLTAPSKFRNISTRALVQTGDNVMIGGLIITGPDAKKVIVRAIGPSLAHYGIANPLNDPTLELHDGNGIRIAFNDNWKDSQQSEIQATGLAPSDDSESAIVRTLPPGNYTAIVRGKNNTIGIALVEVYELN